jgi:hypothetical protein
MLFQNRRRGDRGLEAVGGAGGDHAAEGTESFLGLLPIIWKLVQKSLDLKRRLQTLDKTPFFCGESRWGRGPRRPPS